MADFKRRQLEFGLEFVRWSFEAEHNNLSEGSSEPKKDLQVIRVQGRQPHEFLNSNYLFLICRGSIVQKYTYGTGHGKDVLPHESAMEISTSLQLTSWQYADNTVVVHGYHNGQPCLS